MADLHEIELGDGTRIKTALSAERLADWGITPAAPLPTLGERGATAGLGIQMTQDEADRLSGRAPSKSDGGGLVFTPGSKGIPDFKPLPPIGGTSGVKILEAPQGGSLGFSPGLSSFAESDESVKRSDKAAAQTIDKARGRDGAPAGPVARFGAGTKDIDTSGGDTGGQQPGAAPERPRYVTIKAGNTKGAYIKTGFSTKKSGATDALPDYQEQQADARIDKKLALGQAADVKTENLKQEIGDAQADRTLADAAYLQAQRQQAEAQARQEKAMQNVAALQGEWEQIQKDKIDPNEYWEGLGTGGKILAGIGMIAGGIRAGLQGGPNQAMGFIRSAIRDNINDQKDKMEARRAGFNVKKTMLEKTADLLGGNVALAEQVLEAKHLAVTQAMMRARNASGSLSAVPAELASAYADIDVEGSDKMMKALGQYGADVTEQNQFIADRTVQVGGPGPALKPEARERMVRLPGGGYGFVRAGADRAPVQEKLTANGDVIALVKQMRAIAEDPNLPLSDKRAKWESLRAQAEPIFSVANKQGAMSDGERDGANRIMGDPGAILTGHDTTRLKTFEDGLTARLRSTTRDWVHADPDATIPVVGAPSQGRRYEQ